MFALKNFREIMDNLNSDTDFIEDDLHTFEEKVRLEFQLIVKLISTQFSVVTTWSQERT